MYLISVFVISSSFLFSTFPLGGNSINCDSPQNCKKGENRCAFCVGTFHTGYTCRAVYGGRYQIDSSYNCSPNGCDYLGCAKDQYLCFYIYENGRDRGYPATCVCNAGSYGTKCDKHSNYPGKSTWLAGVALTETPHFPGEETPLKIRLYVSSSAKTIFDSLIWTLEADQSNGFFIERVARVCTDASGCQTNFGPKHSYIEFEFKNRLPYKMFELLAWDESFLYFDDLIYGYVAKVRVRVVDSKDNRTIYNEEHPIFVDYEGDYKHSLKCIPLIELHDCGASPNTAVTKRRFTSIKLSSAVQYLNNGERKTSSVPSSRCADSAQFTWKIWRMHLADESFETLTTPVFEMHAKEPEAFPPYWQDFGKYKVLLEVKHVSGSGTSLNYQYCYFDVVALPLVAQISGGTERKVFKEFGLTLEWKALNPNEPDNEQGHVISEWSCDKEGPVCKPKTFIDDRVYEIKPENLDYGVEYKFTLRVSTKKYDQCTYCSKVEPQHQYVLIKVAEKEKKTQVYKAFEIRCLQNCGDLVVPSAILYLRVKFIPSVLNSSFVWTYSKSGAAHESTDAIRQKTDDSQLIIDADKLDLNSSYTITVKENSTDWYASYSFRTDILLFNGECKVEPDAGVEGTDPFIINCTSDAEHFRYEFYDKTTEEVASGYIFNGRFLGTSKTGLIRNVRLTRGKVMTYIYNERGLSVTRDINVKLTHLDYDDKVKNKILKELQGTIQLGNTAAILGYISFIPDIISADKHEPNIFHALLDAFKYVGMSNDLGDVKLWVSSMANVLLGLNRPTPLALEPDAFYHVMRDLSRQVLFLKDVLFRNGNKVGVIPKQVESLSRGILNCMSKAIISANMNYVETDGENTYKYILENLRLGSDYNEIMLDRIQEVVSAVQSRGQPPTKIASDDNNIVVWVMKHDEVYTVQQMLENYDDIPMKMSNHLLSNLKSQVRSNEDLTFQVAFLQNNIFWWEKSDVQSTLTSVSLTRQGLVTRRIKNLAYPLSVIVRVNNKSSNAVRGDGKVQLDPAANIDARDMAVVVHRLYIEPRALVKLQFIYPPTTTDIRVMLSTTIRPDFETMVHSATVINETNNKVTKFIDTVEPTFLYVGILPGPEVPTNKTVQYSFEVVTSLCQTWAHGTWTSQGCKVSHENESSVAGAGHVTCLCQHFSMFAAAFPVPPQEVDSFGDAHLFLTVADNPLVVVLVIGVLLVFLIVCFVTKYYFNRKDGALKKLIVLEDNFPEDQHPYLFAVLTGSRFNAGTTAHVGLQILGEEAKSRRHILTSKTRKVLRCGSDDWFVMFCPKSLGPIKYIKLWHDNHGSSPEWFCDKIHLYDLERNTETLFVLGMWLALRLDCFPEAMVLPAKKSDIENIKRNFMENFTFAMREGHLFISIMLRHHRSKISRLQRIFIIMDCLMVTMFCSIMFFQPEKSAEGVDEGEYTIGTRQILASIQSSFITIFVTSFIVLLFRISYKSDRIPKAQPKLILRDSVDDVRLLYPEKAVHHHSSGTNPDRPRNRKPTEANKTYKRFVKIVKRSLRLPTLMPVQATSRPPVIKIKQATYVIAWMSSVSVIVCCAYLVMLHGLKLGLVRSQKWLSSVLMAVGQEALVFGPIRFASAAVVLSLMYQKMFKVFCHCVTVDEALELRPKIYQEEEIEDLIIKRTQPMYTPLSHTTKNLMLRRQQVRKNWWTLADFTLGLMFVFVLYQLISQVWLSNYQATSNVDRLITLDHPSFASPDPETRPDFHDIVNIPLCESYLYNTFIDAILKIRWYNGDLLKSVDYDNKYWAADSVNRLFGYPQVRQLRVVPKSCENLIGVRGLCTPHWSKRYMDTDLYSTGWSTATLADIIKPNNPWRYTEHTNGSVTTIYRLYGASGRVYDSGGYSLSVPSYSVRSARVELGALRQFGWQDRRTRALFVELTLYNANMDMFSQATLTVEYIVSGATLTLSRVTSVEVRLRYNVWCCLFVLCVFYYFFRVLYLANRHGLLDFLKDLNNQARLAVVVLGFATIVLATLHHFHSTGHVKHGKGKQEYFDFDIFYQYFPYLQYTLSFLMSVSIVRMLMLLRLGRPLLSIVYTFIISRHSIVWMSIVVVMLYLVLNTAADLVDNHLPAALKDVALVKSKLGCDHFVDGCALFTEFLALKIGTSFLLGALYIATFVYYRKIAKLFRRRLTDDFNFLTFIRKRVVRKLLRSYYKTRSYLW